MLLSLLLMVALHAKHALHVLLLVLGTLVFAVDDAQLVEPGGLWVETGGLWVETDAKILSWLEQRDATSNPSGVGSCSCSTEQEVAQTEAE